MQFFAMNAPLSRPASQRYFMWLLWLALLLPMAQVAAAWHVLSHTSVDASDAADGKRALPHPTHCDLCLAATAVSSGALPSAAQTLAHSTVHHPAPQAAVGDVWEATPAPVYRSRAPPSALL